MSTKQNQAPQKHVVPPEREEAWMAIIDAAIDGSPEADAVAREKFRFITDNTALEIQASLDAQKV